MKIYIIRHGETAWNAQRRIQGRSDVELNENGRRLAAVTAAALREIPFDVAYSSPLKRAMETARIILHGRDIPIIPEPDIIEMAFGVFEGEIMTEENPRLAGTGFLNFFTAPDRYQAPEGGEDFSQVCTRTTRFLKTLAARPDLTGKTILVSSHGAAIKGMLSTLYPTKLNDFWHGGVHKNCAVSLVEVENGRMKLTEDGTIYY